MADPTFPETLAGAEVEVSDVDLDEEAVYVNGDRLTDERAEQRAADPLRRCAA